MQEPTASERLNRLFNEALGLNRASCVLVGNKFILLVPEDKQGETLSNLVCLLNGESKNIRRQDSPTSIQLTFTADGDFSARLSLAEAFAKGHAYCHMMEHRSGSLDVLPKRVLGPMLDLMSCKPGAFYQDFELTVPGSQTQSRHIAMHPTRGLTALATSTLKLGHQVVPYSQCNYGFLFDGLNQNVQPIYFSNHDCYSYYLDAEPQKTRYTTEPATLSAYKHSGQLLITAPSQDRYILAPQSFLGQLWGSNYISVDPSIRQQARVRSAVDAYWRRQARDANMSELDINCKIDALRAIIVRQHDQNEVVEKDYTTMDQAMVWNNSPRLFLRALYITDYVSTHYPEFVARHYPETDVLPVIWYAQGKMAEVEFSPRQVKRAIEQIEALPDKTELDTLEIPLFKEALRHLEQRQQVLGPHIA